MEKAAQSIGFKLRDGENKFTLPSHYPLLYLFVPLTAVCQRWQTQRVYGSERQLMASCRRQRPPGPASQYFIQPQLKCTRKSIQMLSLRGKHAQNKTNMGSREVVSETAESRRRRILRFVLVLCYYSSYF